jgi:hypothetical protein
MRRLGAAAVVLGPFAALIISAAAQDGANFSLANVGLSATGTLDLGPGSAPPGVSPAAETLIKRYKRTMLANLTEYNPNTCKPVDVGAWSVDKPPKYGKPSYGTITGHLAGGACPGKTFTFAAIYYTWDRHSNEAISDAIKGRWKAKDFNIYAPVSIRVPVVRPSTETTVAAGWDASGNGLWRQTVHAADDASFDFSFDTVKESNPGGGGPDTCWFKGSAILPFTAITGGTWFPDEHGVWEFDHVGWFTASVTYYRKKKRAPCGTTFPQQMQHKAQVEKGFVNYGPVNTLGGSFTKTTVTSTRAGKKQTVAR